MFGWLKDKAQNAVYATALKALAANAGEDPAMVVAVNAGAALAIVQSARVMCRRSLTFADMTRPNPSIGDLLSTDELARMEQHFLGAAEEARAINRLSGSMFLLAAGYCSAQKRSDFNSDTSLAIVNGIRVAIRACETCGVDETTSISDAMGEVIEYYRNTFF